MKIRHVVYSSLVAAVILFFVADLGNSEPPEERSRLQRLRQPLTEDQMEPWAEIAFSVEKFHKVKRGMTEEEVLDLLGKPLKVKMIRRPKSRWSVHYFYPQGHVVNFKHGLVVGKGSGKIQ